ncbi:hypothetical protein [Andreprevotia chitinilytica]|uniref:hypothetical protein n=1 Tax=Andreprevotia chitinilytica TaxID=396808 RepID=UPI00055066CB|nr:hypothetical protein [Andreprevotia chitinilytica]
MEKYVPTHKATYGPVAALSGRLVADDQRLLERRRSLDEDDAMWQYINYALNGNERRTSRGRRKVDRLKRI